MKRIFSFLFFIIRQIETQRFQFCWKTSILCYQKSWQKFVKTIEVKAIHKILTKTWSSTHLWRQEGREQERIRIRRLEEAAKKEKDAPKAEIPKVEGSMPRTLRRPNAENGPVETLETQNVTGPRSSVLRNLSLNSTSSVRTTSGESAYDKYLRMEMAQEK